MDQVIKTFKVFVYLQWKISDFEDELEDEFVSSEGSDVGQNILINFCNLLYLVFLCNFRYFRFRAFISLFFGVFNVV